MPSAACYTNKRRVLAESGVTKVEYPGKIAVNNGTLSVQNCSPNFNVLFYRPNVKCVRGCPTPITQTPNDPFGLISGGVVTGGIISGGRR